MCGLFGWKFNEEVNPAKVAILGAVLAEENVSRGKDSWGVYNADTNKILRGLGEISNTDLSYMGSVRVLMGHTRNATQGTIKETNCHPFRFEHLVGAHNGMVFNHSALNKMYKRNFRVDSMHIFQHLLEKKPMLDIEAFGAATWYDTKQQSVYLCEFSGSLNIAVILGADEKVGIGVVWSSQKDALIKALTMAGLPYQLYNVESDQVYQVIGGELFVTDETMKFSPYSASRISAYCDYEYEDEPQGGWVRHGGKWTKTYLDNADNKNLARLNKEFAERQDAREQLTYSEWEERYVEKHGKENFQGNDFICCSCGNSLFGKPYISTYTGHEAVKGKDPERWCKYCYDMYLEDGE